MTHTDHPTALVWTQHDVGPRLLEHSPQVEVLGSTGRTSTAFRSDDDRFVVGGFEVDLVDDFEREHRYDPFPRDEFMFFTKGGMQFHGDDGSVVEAGPGDMLFIPKGWQGRRVITGDGVMQKLAVAYVTD